MALKWKSIFYEENVQQDIETMKGTLGGFMLRPSALVTLLGTVPPYVLSQVAGSSLAILTLFVMLNTSIPICATVTQFSSPTTIPEAFTWEFIISFILMLAICGVATDSRAINELSGVTVGATVLVNVLLAGPITGASMNPARSIGPALVSMEFDCLWIYIVAPILGTTTATVIYSFVRLPLPEKRL
ncbi:Aquaporin NIP1-2 [Vitis vinifera]|uniref:Aquaporin NIP1-2 n=1 Tax=Vitis vinifera TaxID=29760 RepID=A0A438KR76_VITVI|nr:Aquaporin NIP1-2 [Vitis vinifera]